MSTALSLFPSRPRLPRRVWFRPGFFPWLVTYLLGSTAVIRLSPYINQYLQAIANLELTRIQAHVMIVRLVALHHQFLRQTIHQVQLQSTIARQFYTDTHHLLNPPSSATISVSKDPALNLLSTLHSSMSTLLHPTCIIPNPFSNSLNRPLSDHLNLDINQAINSVRSSIRMVKSVALARRAPRSSLASSGSFNSSSSYPSSTSSWRAAAWSKSPVG